MTLKVLEVHHSSTLALNRNLQFLTTEVDNSVSVGSVLQGDQYMVPERGRVLGGGKWRPHRVTHIS